MSTPAPSIRDHLQALIGVATQGNRAQEARLGLMVLASVGSDFLIMYSLLMGLARGRAGEPFARELLLFLLGVAVFYTVYLRMNRELNRRYTDVARDMINNICRRLPRLPALDYQRLDQGTLMTRILGDGNQVAACRQSVFSVLSGGLRLLLGGLFAMSLSFESSVVAFVGLVLIATTATGQLRTLRAGYTTIAADNARMYALLRSQVAGGVALKVHHPRATAVGRAFDEVSSRVRQLREALFTSFYGWQYVGDALVYSLLGVNVFLIPLIADVSSEGIRELNMVTLWLVLGAVKLATGIPRMSSAGMALARLRDLEQSLADDVLEPAVREADLDGGIFADFERVTIRDLWFQYPSQTKRPAFPLGPLSVDFRRGELVFITGHNGSGKSTFVRLLAGLYRPNAGHIEVDGVEITDETLASWRSRMGTIFVEHCLFERTHGLGEDAEQRAPALLEELGIGDKTRIVDGRITNLDLSTGQKKRLAMALLRLENKPVLILDEWAADQDPEYRELFYTQLLPALRDEGRLVIAVTHDDRYFDCADRCLRFEGGRLVEEGAET